MAKRTELFLVIAGTQHWGVSGKMRSKLDIFRGKPDGTPVWVRTAENLDDAKDQVRQLVAATRDEYFVFDSRRGAVIRINWVETRPAAA
jgi:hypothetical protein